MGYWNTSPEGESFNKVSNSDLVWGDTPADAMDDAIDLIREAFRKDWLREPSAAELIAGLRFSINPLVDQGLIKS